MLNCDGRGLRRSVVLSPSFRRGLGGGRPHVIPSGARNLYQFVKCDVNDGLCPRPSPLNPKGEYKGVLN